jgi:hypothetical protein
MAELVALSVTKFHTVLTIQDRVTTRRKFSRLVDCRRFETIFCINRALAAQYSSFGAIARNFVDGKFTLGENIGDLGV